MSTVALDIGNTRIKAGLFEDTLTAKKIFSDTKNLKSWLSEIRGIEHLVVGQVGSSDEVLESLQEDYNVHIAQTDWKHGLTVHYESIETLGIDRLAAVVGVWEKIKDAAIIFDIGSCITIDYVDEQGVYYGGNIAPGWQMRLKAMHEFTANLPLVEAEGMEQLFGKNTKEALQLGAFNGLKFEIERYIEIVKQRKEGINVILTGGNAFQFAKHLKMEIFVLPDIILEGLFNLLHANI